MTTETEADTCRRFVVPRLQAMGWDTSPCAIQEQRSFTDGRIRFVRGAPRRGKVKRADYILRLRRDGQPGLHAVLDLLAIEVTAVGGDVQVLVTLPPGLPSI